MKKRYMAFFVLLGLLVLTSCGTVADNQMEWIPDDSKNAQGEPESVVEQDENQEEMIESEIQVASKVFVLGNSITLGFGTHGMASSTTETDYYYLLNSYLLEKNPEVQMKRVAGFGWEGATTTGERLAFLSEEIEPELEEDVDLIIIQLGDNVNTEEKIRTFGTDCKKLLEWFREKAPKARILWVFGRYNLNNASDIKSACAEYGAEYVNIDIVSTDSIYMSALNNEYEKEDGSIGNITDYGVASHPGDYGMQVICELIVGQLAYDK